MSLPVVETAFVYQNRVDAQKSYRYGTVVLNTERQTPKKQASLPAIKIVENLSEERNSLPPLSERMIVLHSDRVTPMMRAFMTKSVSETR